VLTGAGISAESGIPTFRDADGLWEGHKVEDVATPEAYDVRPANSGVQQGTVHVEHNAQVIVHPSGRLAGTLHNDGLVVNRGTRGGAVTGGGHIQDLDGGTERRPVTRNGVQYYEWYEVPPSWR